MDLAPVLFHLHSTMRMGADRAGSVVDPNGESWFVKRVFIADNSALANGVGGVNPTLTTQALATRTAEKIFAEVFRRRAVGREGEPRLVDRRGGYPRREGRGALARRPGGQPSITLKCAWHR